MTPSDVQATFCATLLDEWCRSGVKDAVVCPGSRSTPLALAIAAETRLTMHVILDERSAAFFAIGIARVTGRPALLLCTSGTAAVEFHSAVVEAHLDHVPMIVVTADRPPELHGIGAPQTVDQNHLYGRSVRAFFEPGVAESATSSTWRSLACRSLLAATRGAYGPGPVHLNLAFREPLVGVARRLPQGRANGEPWHTAEDEKTAHGHLSGDAMKRLSTRLSGRRGVLVAGAASGDAAALHGLAAALGWPLLADPRSGARSAAAGSLTVAHADAILRSAKMSKTLRPDVVVRFGTPWASKVLQQWLATIPDDVLVDPHHAWLDPNRASSVSLAVDPSALCRSLIGLVEPAPNSWLSAWANADSASRRALSVSLDRVDATVTEPAIVRTFSREIPSGSSVVLSSSMPIRDLEWYAGDRSDVMFLSNRGANGIDGVVSTALGAASGSDGPTFALVGDLAFLHDAGALVLAAQHRANCTLVVIDNAGGGIFEFLPQATAVERKRFEALYGTPQTADIVRLAQAHGLKTSTPKTLRALSSSIKKSSKETGVSVIVMRTDRQQNVLVHDELNSAVVRAVEAIEEIDATQATKAVRSTKRK